MWIAIWAILAVFATPSGGRGNTRCPHLPGRIKSFCICQESDSGAIRLQCKGLNSTDIFHGQNHDPGAVMDRSLNSIGIFDRKPNQQELEEYVIEKIDEIIIRDSHISSANLQNFNEFIGLKKLTLSSIGLKDLGNPDNLGSTNYKLHSLTVTGNHHLSRVERKQLPQNLSAMRYLNLSGNSIKFIGPIFKDLTQLETIDLSSNLLDDSLAPSTFKSVEFRTLNYLDISSKCLSRCIVATAYKVGHHHINKQLMVLLLYN